jgi:hypothetical protein
MSIHSRLLSAENSNLRAENTRLRAALEAAPEPNPAYQGPNPYIEWYDGPRAKALKVKDAHNGNNTNGSDVLPTRS